MKILMWLPQIGAAVVQGETNQYLVFYQRYTCTCPHHTKGHHQCKHIRFVLDELVPGLDASPGIECDSCNLVKPESDFGSPGHLAGGSAYGYDIDSCVCAECVEKTLRLVREDLAKAVEAEMAYQAEDARIAAEMLALREHRKALGLCTECGSPLTNGRCQPCQDNQDEQESAWIARQQVDPRA